MQRHSEAFWK